MASRSRYMARAGHRYMGGERGDISIVSSEFELEESDVWGGGGYPCSGSPPEISKRQMPPTGSRVMGSGCRKQSRSSAGVPSSLPVNIPDWSRILREEPREGRHHREFEFGGGDVDDEGGEEFGGVRVPPHEMVARKQRMASFSVYEGVGRTLKGRDLSRVRNAIWAQTGFQD